MNFYPYNIICSAFAVFVYVTFRMGVNSYLRVHKNSKTFIRKNKKGYSNYWLYNKLHAEVGLGYIYTLNILLIVLTAVYLFSVVCLGWAEFFSIPIATCNAALCAVQIPAILFSDVYWNLEHYGKRFVMLEKNKSGGGFHSSFYAIIESVVLSVFAVYNIFLAV